MLEVVCGETEGLEKAASVVLTASMAKSKWEYVKGFEQEETLLPSCWIVIRLDGHSFTRHASWLAVPAYTQCHQPSDMHVLRRRFAKDHDFEKPNDIKALALMDYAAQASVLLKCFQTCKKM